VRRRHPVPASIFLEETSAEDVPTLREICWGSAGVYNVTQTATSLELLAEKMRHVQCTRAQTIVTANLGCLLQLRVGVDIHHTHQEVLHVVELLDRAIASARAQK